MHRAVGAVVAAWTMAMVRMLMMRGMMPKSTLSGNLAWGLLHIACQLTLRKLFTIVPPALDKTLFVWYIITMKDDIVEITFIAAISVSLIVKLLTL